MDNGHKKLQFSTRAMLLAVAGIATIVVVGLQDRVALELSVRDLSLRRTSRTFLFGLQVGAPTTAVQSTELSNYLLDNHLIRSDLDDSGRYIPAFEHSRNIGRGDAAMLYSTLYPDGTGERWVTWLNDRPQQAARFCNILLELVANNNVEKATLLVKECRLLEGPLLDQTLQRFERDGQR